MTRRLMSVALGIALTLALAASSDAQGPKDPKGVTVKGLVSSLGPLGGFGSITANLLLTGATVEIQPGGQTGRERFLVPTFIYVIEGVLITEYDPGPIAHGGTHYFSAGQSHVDSKALWHNFKSGSDKPVKYVILHVGYPGEKTSAKPDVE